MGIDRSFEVAFAKSQLGGGTLAVKDGDLVSVSSQFIGSGDADDAGANDGNIHVVGIPELRPRSGPPAAVSLSLQYFFSLQGNVQNAVVGQGGPPDHQSHR